MKELALKYGCNPNQGSARIYMNNGSELPIEVLNGRPGYINFLDAFNSWQLVKELKEATGLPAAASFKHVSPAGAALSDVCDVQTAKMLAREVSDGVIAPGYTEEALTVLKGKRKGTYNIIKIDENYKPELLEHKQVFGITFEQERNEAKITADLLQNRPTVNKEIPEGAARDLLISLIVLKYTQSNSVCYVKDGQAIGIGAGQQSRVHCTRLAGGKADIWWLRQNPKVLALPFKDSIRRPDRDNTIDVYISDDYEDVLADGVWENFFTEKPEPLTREEKKAWVAQLKDVALGSDAFFPFGDNIERAHRSGVQYIAQAGGSIRDDNVIETCDKYGIAMAFTGLRLFHH